MTKPQLIERLINRLSGVSNFWLNSGRDSVRFDFEGNRWAITLRTYGRIRVELVGDSVLTSNTDKGNALQALLEA